MQFPVTINCSQSEAENSDSAFMAQVFDYSSFLSIMAALSKVYLHVMAWDNMGTEVYTYDNR